jgi:hypothetical protein
MRCLVVSREARGIDFLFFFAFMRMYVCEDLIGLAVTLVVNFYFVTAMSKGVLEATTKMVINATIPAYS